MTLEHTQMRIAAGPRTANEGARATRDAAFDELYAQHAPFIWRTLRALRVDAADAEDAMQEVFVTVHRRLAEFEGRSSLRTWLCGIALGVAKNYTRKTKRRAHANAKLPMPGTHPPASDATEAIDLVAKCLADLSEPLRLVFIFAELERMTAPEIAEALTLNLNTVYSRLRLAREQFEASVARHGGTSP